MGDRQTLISFRQLLGHGIKFLEWAKENAADVGLHDDIHLLIIEEERLKPLNIPVSAGNLNQIKNFLEKSSYSVPEIIELFQVARELFKNVVDTVNSLESPQIPANYIQSYIGALFLLYLKKNNPAGYHFLKLSIFINLATSEDGPSQSAATKMLSTSVIPLESYRETGRLIINLFKSPASAWSVIQPWLNSVLVNPSETAVNILDFIREKLKEKGQNGDLAFIKELLETDVTIPFGSSQNPGDPNDPNNPSNPNNYINIKTGTVTTQPDLLKLITTINGYFSYTGELGERWQTVLSGGFEELVAELIIDSADLKVNYSAGIANVAAGLNYSDPQSNSSLSANLRLENDVSSQFSLTANINGNVSHTRDIGELWELITTGRFDDLEFELSSGSLADLPGSFLAGSSVEVNLRKKPAAPDAGDTARVDGNIFTVGDAGVKFTISGSGVKVVCLVKDCQLLISPSGSDGFIGSVLPEGGGDISFDLLYEFGYNQTAGFYHRGSFGQEIKIPVTRSFGPLTFRDILIKWNLGTSGDDHLSASFATSIDLDMSLLSVTVEQIGFVTRLRFPGSDPASLSLGFKPPAGVGLRINTGAVTGGGYLFFDHEKEEYAGALELTIAGFISTSAIGVITTRLPDGKKGYSMLVIITAEFNPPFQLGFGFSLIGVGGLLGMHRTVLLDQLRDGVRTGSAANVLFPENVVANAPRIISDLKTFFPVYQDKFLAGPMGKIGWGTPTLIRLSLGLIIEIPGNVAILGILKISLPDEKVPLVVINVAFLGTIDFGKNMVTFDASLYESSILKMTLEGDMAVRLRWGDSPDFILTVGGFHPSYSPPPMALPTLRRLSISILNTSNAKIRIECYQAITSNTAQFGARAEIYFKLSACSINGHIAFDALFRFSPFYFIIQLSSSFSLKAFGRDVMSVRIKMSLEGPTPWNAKGTGSISLLFFSISANFDKTWGDNKDTSLPDIKALPLFLSELEKSEQWSTQLAPAGSLLVTLRHEEEADNAGLVLHPSGSLMVQQKLMPLKVNIDRIGNQKTSDIRKVTISKAFSIISQGEEEELTVSDIAEYFAPANFADLSDAEKLSSPSFEKMPGGVTITPGEGTVKSGKMVRRKVEYQVTIVDKEPVKPFAFGQLLAEIGIMFTTFIRGSSVSKSVLSASHQKKMHPFGEKLDIVEEGFSVAFQSTNKVYNQAATFSSEMEARSFMQDNIEKNPSLKDQVHIVPNYELQES